MNGRDTYRIEQRINTDMMIVRRRYFTHLDTSRACAPSTEEREGGKEVGNKS